MSQPGSGRALVAAAVIIINMVSMAAGDIGTASMYGPPYTPTKCNGYDPTQFPSGDLFAAASDGVWDNGAACGRNYKVRCISSGHPKNGCRRKTVTVRVVDLCKQQPCPSTLQLPYKPFVAISKYENAKINIEYQEVNG